MHEGLTREGRGDPCLGLAGQSCGHERELRLAGSVEELLVDPCNGDLGREFRHPRHNSGSQVGNPLVAQRMRSG